MGALSFYWVIIAFKKGGCCCVAPGLLGRCNAQLQFVPMLSSAWDCREQFLVFLLSSNFQTWKDCREPCDKARYQAISPRDFILVSKVNFNSLRLSGDIQSLSLIHI